MKRAIAIAFLSLLPLAFGQTDGQRVVIDGANLVVLSQSDTEIQVQGNVEKVVLYP
jgi:hypothetical protein